MSKKLLLIALFFSSFAFAEITFVPYAKAVSTLGKGKPVMLEVGTKDCAGCKAMHAVLAPYIRKHPSYQIFYVDVNEKLGKRAILDTRPRKTVGDKLVIGGYPVQVFYDKSGREVYRHSGVLTEAQLDSICKKLGFR